MEWTAGKPRAEEETAIECLAFDTKVAVGAPHMRVCFKCQLDPESMKPTYYTTIAFCLLPPFNPRQA